MQDAINLNPPAMVNELAQAAAECGFTMSSDLLTGALLRTLVASKPGGAILELGTGVGMGTSWMLAGMDATARLISIDNGEETTAIARRFFCADTRVTFHVLDGIAFIHACHEQRRTFDLIYADTYPGKFEVLDETLALLNKGGLYVIDDLNPQPSWPKGHQPKVERLIEVLERREDLHITKFDWSTGLIVATKK